MSQPSPLAVPMPWDLVSAAYSEEVRPIFEVFAPAMSAMAAPVVVQGTAVGCVTIAGPAVRLNEARMHALSGALMETAREIAAVRSASSLFRGRSLR